MLLERENDDEEKAFKGSWTLESFETEKKLFISSRASRKSLDERQRDLNRQIHGRRGVFVRSINSKDKIIDEMYWQP